MAGVKGRSGRRSMSEEIRMRELRNKVIIKAWNNTDKLLSVEHPPKEANSIAGNIVVKDMTDKQSIDSRQEIALNISQEEQDILNKYINVDRQSQN